MENSEFVLQVWHIVGFFVSFCMGGWFTTWLMLPYVKAMKRHFEQHPLCDECNRELELLPEDF